MKFLIYPLLLCCFVMSHKVTAQLGAFLNTDKGKISAFKAIIRIYEQAHRKANSYDDFEILLEDTQMKVYDDFWDREMRTIQEYLQKFQERIDKEVIVQFIRESAILTETKNNGTTFFFRFSIERVLRKVKNQKDNTTNEVVFRVSAQLDAKTNMLSNFKVFDIINPFETSTESNNLPYISGVAIGGQIPSVWRLKANNIGARQSSSPMFLLGASLSLNFGVRDINVLRGIRFLFNISAGFALNRATWNRIDSTDVTLPVADTELTIQGGKSTYTQTEFMLKLYWNQTFNYDQSWEVADPKQKKRDFYLLGGYGLYNYTFHIVQENVNALVLSGGAIALGVGYEWWNTNLTNSWFIELNTSINRPQNENLGLQGFFIGLRGGYKFNSVRYRRSSRISR